MEFHAKYSQMQFNLQKSNKTLCKLKGQHGLYQYFNSQLGVHPERDWQVRGNQVWLAWKCSKLKWKHGHMQVVSLQNFEQFDVIFIVDKSTEHGILLICFLQ